MASNGPLAAFNRPVNTILHRHLGRVCAAGDTVPAPFGSDAFPSPIRCVGSRDPTPASGRLPDAVIAPLVETLRRTLGEFIDPDTDRIGHAFPVDGSKHGRRTFRQDGLLDEESESPLREFACALVQVYRHHLESIFRASRPRPRCPRFRAPLPGSRHAPPIRRLRNLTLARLAPPRSPVPGSSAARHVP